MFHLSKFMSTFVIPSLCFFSLFFSFAARSDYSLGCFIVLLLRSSICSQSKNHFVDLLCPKIKNKAYLLKFGLEMGDASRLGFSLLKRHLAFNVMSLLLKGFFFLV